MVINRAMGAGVVPSLPHVWFGGAARAVVFPRVGSGGEDGGIMLYRSTPLVSAPNSSQGICSLWIRQLIPAAAGFAPWFAQISGSLLNDPGFPWDGTPDPDDNDGFLVVNDITGAETGPKTILEDGANPLVSRWTAWGDAVIDDWFSSWSHLITSWKTNAAVGSRTSQFVLNGTLLTTNITSDIGVSFVVPWETKYPIIGNGYYPGAFGHSMHGFDMAEFYLNTQDWLDLSVAENVEKFRTAGGVPANLGATGATPTGNIPSVYLSVGAGQTASNFAVNRGSGGEFITSGTLVLATTDPF